MILAALRVLPALYAHKIRHKAGDVALQQRVIPQDNVFFATAGFVQLGCHWWKIQNITKRTLTTSFRQKYNKNNQ
jgi:hypothetical protein